MINSVNKLRAILIAVQFGVMLATAHTAHAQTETGGPAIVVPDGLLAGGQRSDAPIDVRFVTAPDTPVDIGSLHIWVHKFVGWVDITDRLLRHPQVHVSSWGIHLEGGVVPAGEHLVRLALHDVKGRIAETTETIRIVQAGESFTVGQR